MTTPSTPDFLLGQIPTPTQWNSFFAAKADYNGDGSFATLEVSGASVLSGSLAVAGATSLGNGSANYLLAEGAPTGSPASLTATGTDANISLLLAPKGGGGVQVVGTIETTVYTVATLPAAGTAGRRAFVSDSSVTTFGTTVAGGGSDAVPVYDTGSAWVVG